MNSRFERLLNLPAWQRALMLLVLLGVIVALFYFSLYQNQIDEHAGLVEKRDKVAVQLKKNQKIANNYAVYKAEYEQMQTRLNEALSELPLKREIPSLLSGIADQAKEKGLDVLRFKPGKESIQGFYAEVPVELKLSGSYHQAASFFDSISKMKRIVNIQGLSLAKGKSKDNRTALSIACRAITFRFVDNPPEKKSKKKGRRK